MYNCILYKVVYQCRSPRVATLTRRNNLQGSDAIDPSARSAEPGFQRGAGLAEPDDTVVQLLVGEK